MTQKRPTHWQVVGIGVVSGILMTNLGFIIFWTYRGVFSWQYNFIDFLFLTIIGIVLASPWGIAGALAGRNWKNNISTTWIGAITAIIGLGSFFLILSYRTSNIDRYSLLDIISFLENCFLFLLPGLPFGIIGAMIGKGWKQSSPVTRVRGVLGAIIGIILFGWSYLWASGGFSLG